MSRLTRPPKGFAIVGALLIGFLPGVAQAKWIKATVSGNIDATGSATADSLTAGGPVSLDFVIQNYSRTSVTGGGTNSWKQTTGKYNYSQLFNYGTGITGLAGNYNASSVPDGTGNIVQSKDDGSDFLMRVSGNPSSGLYFTRSGTPTSIKSILVSGAIPGFSSAVVPASLDVVDFLSASGAIGTHTCSPSTPCGSGEIEPDSGQSIKFQWTSVKFEQMQSVPGPLPLTGVLAAFRFSRKIRTRIKSC
jgi:hypothetical protein